LHRWCGERADGHRDPTHSRCAARGLLTPATVTDHVVALAQGGAHCDPTNSQSLCGACNRRKAQALEGALAVSP
jgi:5-methylcytosine-specific restriction endonuclease McrA